MKILELIELQAANEKAEHGRWIETKVQVSLKGLTEGSNHTYSQAEWSAIKAARKVRCGT